jgi:chromosome segregation ATPase
MEFEQIVKRLEWLDTEQRKSKSSLASIEERLASVEANSKAVLTQVKELSKELSQVSANTARMDQFNQMLAKQRDDFSKMLEEIEKKHQRRESEAAKQHQKELELLNKEFTQFKEVSDVAEFRKELKARNTEQMRLNEGILQLKPRIDEVFQVHEELKNTQRIYEETRRQDVKRVTDMQGELTALRKRMDETRAKGEVNADGLRNVDNRISEILNSETERKTSQAAFLEQQAMAQVDRDRAFKEWRERFEEFKSQTATFETQVVSMNETLRSAQKAQETYTELNTKLERRINEISEMQRLAEDRLRQEWVTFKADDQKRWTGLSLSQEESVRDMRKDMDKLKERATALDDIVQVLQDQVHQTTDATEKQLQELMNVTHEWMTTYQRIMGRGKKATKTTRASR